MKGIIETFSPSGCEEQMRELLKHRLRGKFDQITTDNMGNLAAKSGNGGLCIECGMDTTGVMIVSKEEDKAYFAAVGTVKPKAIAGRTVIFADGSRGTVEYDKETDLEKAKLSDLYIIMDTDRLNIGDFGAVAPEFEQEDCAYAGYGLKNRIGLAAVCKALENVEDTGNISVLFSAQKRLGARGLRAFFGANGFDGIITVDGSSEDGCTIVAKDGKIAANKELRTGLEKIAEECDVLAETVVTEENFCLEQISVSCGDPCAAIGISVLCGEGEPDRVNKADFDAAVKLLEEIIKRGA